MEESKYLEFFKAGHTGKTEVYNILSKHQGYVIGHIRWYGPWRQYCFYTAPNCVFNTGCLQDIQDFIGELMTERKRVKSNVPEN